MPIVRTLQQAKSWKGKRVLVRVDFNVPLRQAQGKPRIVDDSRIKASLPSIQYLQKKGAKVILVTHLGRPDGKVVPELSVVPVAKKLGTLLKKEVKVVSFANLTLLSPTRRGELNSAESRGVVMLENIRFQTGEEKNDPAFTRELASLADIFVLDGFAVAHRAAASVSGVAKYLPSFAGLLLQKEIEGMNRVLQKPKKPAVFIIGGAKIETKLPVIKNILKSADAVLVGGAIINVYLKAKGYEVGASLVDHGYEDVAKTIFSKKKIIKPVDVIVGDKAGKKVRVVEIGSKPHQLCEDNEAILDIGPATLELFQKYIKSAKTIVWNGAMGLFEVSAYATGTFEIARSLAQKKNSFTVIGGGETLQAMEAIKGLKKINLVSTGGGAMLEYLSGKKLPGVESVCSFGL